MIKPDVLAGQVRTVLATLGGIAVGLGYVSQTDVGEIVEAGGQLAAAGGALVVAIVGAWSLVNKFLQRRKVQEALMTPPPGQ